MSPEHGIGKASNDDHHHRRTHWEIVMNIRGTNEHGVEFGALSAIASFVGAFAIVGFVLLDNDPQAPYGSLPATPYPATSYDGTDPSVPSASSVFGNRTEEPSAQIETF